MNGMMKILQHLEDANISSKGVTKTNKDETKQQKEEFLEMLFSTLEANLSGNMLTGKGMLRVGYRNKEGKEMLRAGYGSSINQFNSTPSFNKLSNTKVLSEWT